MPEIKIDRDACMECGQCALACPLGLLLGKPGRKPIKVRHAETACLNCGHCASVCPSAAISVAGVSGHEMTMTAPLEGALEVVSGLVQRRRSIRRYRPEGVERARIEALIDATRWAPTAKNSQSVCWLLVEGRERTRELAGLTVAWLRSVPGMDDVVAAWDHGVDVILRDAPLLMVVHAPADGLTPQIDCTIALTTFELLAAADGLGTCWAGYFMMSAARHPPVAEALGLPEGHALYGALMCGVPALAYDHVPTRAPAHRRWMAD